MSSTKQVKVDNWGVFFLQRLKHFFNRTDYCDLTLQFQDFAHLKVHRLVLNACTEYFEILEGTCEKYEDYLVMPDDLQVDVVVPIINFMYTGQLEYDVSLYDRLYSTAKIMNMSVLTKLLDAQKQEIPPPTQIVKKEILLMNSLVGDKGTYLGPSTSFQASTSGSNFPRKLMISGRQYGPAAGTKIASSNRMTAPNKPPAKIEKPRPTRYEVPEELENDEIFESSFSDISYESHPLMKSKTKQSEIGQNRVKGMYDEASCSKKFEELQASSSRKRPRLLSDEYDNKPIDMDHTSDSYQHKAASQFIDDKEGNSDEDIFDTQDLKNNSKTSNNSRLLSLEKEDSNSIFSHLNDSASKSTGKPTVKPQHAKIISEVLKKYPHLVKTNTNIKLKVWPGIEKYQGNIKATAQDAIEEAQRVLRTKNFKQANAGQESSNDWTYVNKNMNSEAMAKLVSLGASNTTGPWLCLMCGTPGKALSFPSYNKYYHHLVKVHEEKVSANICEHCGYKSGKRNHLLHHMYTKHNVPPPSTYTFPKCNQCDYIALTEAFLIKHKMSHFGRDREFSCSVCSSLFRSRNQLLNHIQATGHKISPDRKTSNQCVYCNKIFLRENNLYTHLKLAHKEVAQNDGIIDNSDEEDNSTVGVNKFEDEFSFELSNSNSHEERVNIKQEFDGKIQIIPNNSPKKNNILNQQILLNANLINKSMSLKPTLGRPPKTKMPNTVSSCVTQSSESESLGNVASGIAASLGLVDRFVVLNDNEYILQTEPEHQSIPMDQSIEHVPVGMDDNQEVILSDLPGDDYSTHYTIEVSMPQPTTTSQIMTSKMVKLPVKTVQPIKSSVIQNQPYQTVITTNQPYENLVSSSSIIYSNNGTLSTAASISPKYVQSTDNIHLETSAGTVMVLQNDDYNMTQSMPNDGSNIVVVYSHPLESNVKQFVQVDQSHFTNISENQQIETNEQIQETEDQGNEDNTGSEVILSEHGLVHETVETWQEENIESTHLEEKHSHHTDVIQNSEDVIIHEEIPVSENVVTETTDEPNIIEKDDNIQNLRETSDSIETVTNEVVITTPEEDINQCETETNEDICESQDLPPEEVENVIENDHESNADHFIGEHEIIENQQDSVVIMESEEAMEVDCPESTIDNNQESSDKIDEPEDTPKQVEKLALEWSDDEMSSREVVQEDGSECPPEVPSQIIQQIEVEESIENIEKEVQKHIQEKDIDSRSINALSPTEKSAEIAEDMQDDEQTLVMEEQQEEDSPSVDESSLIDKSTLKQKTVEKISNLLNDWDDNDSQSDAVESCVQSNTLQDNTNNDLEINQSNLLKGEEKKITSCPPVVANIHKLVSDWDDDEDK